VREAFKTRWLARFARRENIDDKSLCDSIDRADRGLIDADLGSGLIKQRVARRGKGRSGGYRMIVAYRKQGRAVFLYAFAKSERANISPDELEDLREVGAMWLAASAKQIAVELREGTLEEIVYEDKET